MKRFFILTVLLFTAAGFAAEKTYVSQSARQIPLIAEVDVLVIGGTTGGVAAAAEAARAGSEVYLVGPKPYLGEDICSHFRYWLDKDYEISDSLVKEMFKSPEFIPWNYSYKFSIEPDRLHRDSDPPGMLNDGMWASAASHSVQFNDDVVITADLGSVKAVPAVHLYSFQKPGDYALGSVEISISNDGKNWSSIDKIINDPQRGDNYFDDALMMARKVDRKARFVKFDIKKHKNARRVLIGEIILESDKLKDVNDYRLAPRPNQVKMALENELLESGVKFLYRSFVTDMLIDGSGKAAGAVITNRSGRQAIKAKCVIDATMNASLCRAAEAEFTEFKPGKVDFTRYVVGNEPVQNSSLSMQKMPMPVPGREEIYNALKYTAGFELEDDSFAGLSEIDHKFRDMTWRKAQLDCSENPFFVSVNNVVCRRSFRGKWPGAENLDINTLLVKNIDSLYVLSGYADIPRREAAMMFDPCEYVALGRRVGKAAAGMSASAGFGEDVKVHTVNAGGHIKGEVKEFLGGTRAFAQDFETIESPQSSLPVIGRYDVVVAGGGTAGAPAGISAARAGAKTLVVEYLNGLGGVSTVGLIGRYHYGNITGFCTEIDQGVIELGGEYAQQGPMWNCQVKQEWFRKAVREAGGDVWFDSMGCGAFVEGDTVKGLIVATPYGRGVVLCDVVVDGTGNGEVAIAAGARMLHASQVSAAMQGTGYSPNHLGAMYNNTDYLVVDESDIVDVTRATIVARKKYSGEYDLSSIINTRERQVVLGEHYLTPLEMLTGKTFNDTICYARSNVDTHGFLIAPVYYVTHPDVKRRGIMARLPYRSLVPKGLEGVLVSGIGVSAHRDVIPILRMQPDVQNQGYVAGLAAAMASKSGKGVRRIDVKQLQRELIRKGNIPEYMYDETDEFEITEKQIARAIDEIIDDPTLIPFIMAAPERSLPMLRRAYAEETNRDKKIHMARVLGVMGDDTGIDTLVSEIKKITEWDKGYIWRESSHEPLGTRVSPLDGLIISAGYSGSKKAVPAILEKLSILKSVDGFSHHRSVAIALERLGGTESAIMLAQHLNKPEMSGYHLTSLEKAIDDETVRYIGRYVGNAFREIILARALYKCGDYESVGENILREYKKDIRGHFARHANELLKD
ncbi:putative FAD-binding dehydrogenase [Limihaloglobus sulfuriphilus]|uniref:Putative FAD-binding dehydrogenase n=1 Tax=Limihaloglobus sulfuriphilus TaxID=1851148 RepID=A0A1Q2MI08_9BACT|nr:FAD-dependent oxidoreductase [Limihaloglobus sulfuriphilus]AQQ72294.1 putative FAD-binding dehydrogenase [Limihaloglobus sulfuriphilus]